MISQRPLVRAALLALALLVLIAVFADLIAAEAPLVAKTERGWLLLPDVIGRPTLGNTERPPAFAIWAPLRTSPRSKSSAGAFAAPSTAHWLGTDGHAHDVLAVTIHGTRTVLFTTLIVLVIAVSVGIGFGALAGQGTPLPDSLLARAIDITGALPTLVVLAVIRASGIIPPWLSLVLALSLLRSLEIARLVRGEVLRVGGTDYILAARALGASTRHVIRRHLFPHLLGPVLVSAAFTGASVVALEAALGFLGLGLSSDVASWGTLLAQVGHGLSLRAWILPALAAILTTLACYVVADALDDWICARREGPSRV